MPPPTPPAAACTRRAIGHLPGGNTRTGIFFDPFPVAWARGEGAYLWDEDGHRCTDFLGEATAGIYGHNHPIIREAVETQLALGWNFGGHTALEGEMAALLTARFPSLERVRFCNSGLRGQHLRGADRPHHDRAPGRARLCRLLPWRAAVVHRQGQPAERADPDRGGAVQRRRPAPPR